MPLELENLVGVLRDQVRWGPFFAMVQSMEKEMNKASERFEKSRLIEMGLAQVSNSCLEYIDEKGRDLRVLRYPGTFLEVKGNKSAWHKRELARFRLVNGNGKQEGNYNTIPSRIRTVHFGL